MTPRGHPEAAVLRWLYQHPGIHELDDIARGTGFPRDTCGRVCRTAVEALPGLITRAGQTTYWVRAPEFTPEPAAEPEPAAAAEVPQPAQPQADPGAPGGHQAAQVTFTEIDVEIPGDEELYPPFKIQIFYHWRGKRGETWYLARDQHGKTLVFTWRNDD